MAVANNDSYKIIENPLHIRGINASLLHYLSMDQNRFKCLDQKLTGV